MAFSNGPPMVHFSILHSPLANLFGLCAQGPPGTRTFDYGSVLSMPGEGASSCVQPMALASF